MFITGIQVYYRDTGLLQGYRCITGIQVYYRDTGVFLFYPWLNLAQLGDDKAE